MKKYLYIKSFLIDNVQLFLECEYTIQYDQLWDYELICIRDEDKNIIEDFPKWLHDLLDGQLNTNEMLDNGIEIEDEYPRIRKRY